MLANKSSLPRAADYDQNCFLNCTWISLPTLQTLSQQSGLKRKGCWTTIYLATRHQRNHMGISVWQVFSVFFPPLSLSELQQQQQKFWKRNTKPSESVTWEFLSIAKGNSSTKTKHDFKKGMEYSWFLTRKPSNQQPAYCNRICYLPYTWILVCLKSHLCNLVTNFLFIVVYSTGLYDQQGENWRYRDWSPTMCYKQSRFWDYLQRLNTSGNT